MLPRAVQVTARAKLNLGLAVGPRRPDGFHDLATIFQSISLADTLRVEPRRQGFRLVVRWEAVARAGEVPEGSENLVLRAARGLEARFGLPGGAHFTLVKRIPVGAGLGGGSADAAAALVGLRALYGLRLDRKELLDVAAAVGSDVPFSLAGGTAIGLGRGERLMPVALERPFRALIAVPAWRISTPAAYRRIDRVKYDLTAWRTKLRFAERVAHKRLRLVQALSLGNTFESVLGPHRFAFESLCGRLRAAGIRQPRLTGSGSAVFGILESGDSARRIATRFGGTEVLYLVHSTRAGVRSRRVQGSMY
jgi:4-diphosphocytidyl-2-C-methyl-D-erythritol kinase